jgi:hypothetical protein
MLILGEEASAPDVWRLVYYDPVTETVPENGVVDLTALVATVGVDIYRFSYPVATSEYVFVYGAENFGGDSGVVLSADGFSVVHNADYVLAAFTTAPPGNHRTIVVADGKLVFISAGTITVFSLPDLNLVQTFDMSSIDGALPDGVSGVNAAGGKVLYSIPGSKRTVLYDVPTNTVSTFAYTAIQSRTVASFINVAGIERVGVFATQLSEPIAVRSASDLTSVGATGTPNANAQSMMFQRTAGFLGSPDGSNEVIVGAYGGRGAGGSTTGNYDLDYYPDVFTTSTNYRVNDTAGTDLFPYSVHLHRATGKLISVENAESELNISATDLVGQTMQVRPPAVAVTGLTNRVSDFFMSSYDAFVLTSTQQTYWLDVTDPENWDTVASSPYFQWDGSVWVFGDEGGTPEGAELRTAAPLVGLVPLRLRLTLGPKISQFGTSDYVKLYAEGGVSSNRATFFGRGWLPYDEAALEHVFTSDEFVYPAYVESLEAGTGLFMSNNSYELVELRKIEVLVTGAPIPDEFWTAFNQTQEILVPLSDVE